MKRRDKELLAVGVISGVVSALVSAGLAWAVMAYERTRHTNSAAYERPNDQPYLPSRQRRRWPRWAGLDRCVGLMGTTLAVLTFFGISMATLGPSIGGPTAIPASNQDARIAHARQLRHEHMILMAAATKSFKMVGEPKVAKRPPPPRPSRSRRY